jgi:hypothetical protein
VYLRGLPPAQALLTDSCELQEGVLHLCAALQQLVATLRQVRDRLATDSSPRAGKQATCTHRGALCVTGMLSSAA